MSDLIVDLPAMPGAAVPAAIPEPDSGVTALGRLLGGLASRPGPLPKYRYPSAGTLYPVQTYLVLRQALGALTAGSYYYDPETHALAFLSAETPTAPDGSRPAALLVLVAQRAAIDPVYRDEAEAFCLLEAGYMAEALCEAAPELPLREAGDPAAGDGAPLAAALRLEPSHRPLACWAVGAFG